MNKAGTYSYQGDEYQRVCCDLHKNNLFYDQNFRRMSSTSICQACTTLHANYREAPEDHCAEAES